VENGKLIVEIIRMRDATTIQWTGTASSIWDLGEAENFSVSSGSEAEATIFVSGDEVVFNDEATNKTVTVTGNVMPKSFVVNNTKAYTFKGSGSIEGTAQFIKEGEGTVTLSGNNSYTGGNYLKGGITKVSALSNQYSATGNLGGITTSDAKFTMENGAVLQTSEAVEQGSPMKMVGTEGGVINNSGEFLMDKAVSGTLLEKKGAGALKFNATNTLSKLIVSAGHIDCNAGDPAKTVELQSGQIWDNAQATGFAIVVPKGKSGTINLTNTYYTAYANKVTGEGTLTIVPRNTVSRVRITGDWSQFEGTIKHTNTNIWLPLDNSLGIPKGTLDIAEGCGVTNVCKSFKIGKLTGKGSLNHPVANFQNQNKVSGSNTWQVGNSDEKLGNFTFDGTINDDGSSNKSNFEKIGTCKMTVTGAWTNSGTVKVTAGELAIKSGATLGTGALTVAAGATLSGVTKSKVPLTNSSFTINGTIRPGSNSLATINGIDFDGKNVTFGAQSQLAFGLSSTSCTYLTNIGTLKISNGATIAVSMSDINMQSLSTDEGGTNEYTLWTNVNTSNIGELTFDLPELPYSDWDTSKIKEGILIARFNKTKYDNFLTGIENIVASETVEVEIITTNGVVADRFTCPMGSIRSSFANTNLSKGIYLLRIKSETGKKGTMKMMK
jgi:autotransporter-associated beta strand protein